jgi:hypothetical protein
MPLLEEINFIKKTLRQIFDLCNIPNIDAVAQRMCLNENPLVYFEPLYISQSHRLGRRVSAYDLIRMQAIAQSARQEHALFITTTRRLSDDEFDAVTDTQMSSHWSGQTQFPILKGYFLESVTGRYLYTPFSDDNPWEKSGEQLEELIPR